MPSLKRLLAMLKSRGGFMTDVECGWLAHHDAGRMVLVRCNLGRFLCRADQVKGKVADVEKQRDNWVRDVSLPSTDAVWK